VNEGNSQRCAERERVEEEINRARTYHVSCGEQEDEEAEPYEDGLPRPLLGVVEHGRHDRDEPHLCGEVHDAHQRLELLQRHDDRSARHEPHQRRLGQKVNDEAQPACNDEAVWNSQRIACMAWTTVPACVSTTTTNLRMPREAWKMPAKSVAVKASCRNSIGSAVGLTACRSMDPMISDEMDTGPTARSRELPRTAYTIGGTKLESASSSSRSSIYNTL
jgi:hypothetical protein